MNLTGFIIVGTLTFEWRAPVRDDYCLGTQIQSMTKSFTKINLMLFFGDRARSDLTHLPAERLDEGVSINGQRRVPPIGHVGLK